MDKIIFALNQLMMADVNPNNLRFKHCSCFDVGLKRGGWGQVIWEMKVVNRNELTKK